MEQQFEIKTSYGFKGANCLNVLLIENEGQFEVFNDYKEKMFFGSSRDCIYFLKLLVDGFYE